MLAAQKLSDTKDIYSIGNKDRGKIKRSLDSSFEKE